MSHRNSLEIDMGESDNGKELEEFLIHQRDKDNNNSLSGFFSKMGTSVKKYVPKRIGGTGSIEDDIAVRFGMFGGSSSNGSAAPPSSSSESTSCFSRLSCGFTLVRKLAVNFTYGTRTGFVVPRSD